MSSAKWRLFGLYWQIPQQLLWFVDNDCFFLKDVYVWRDYHAVYHRILQWHIAIYRQPTSRSSTIAYYIGFMEVKGILDA